MVLYLTMEHKSGTTRFILLVSHPKEVGYPIGVLAEEIAKVFGSFAEFKDKFSKSAATSFRVGMGVAGKKSWWITRYYSGT